LIPSVACHVTPHAGTIVDEGDGRNSGAAFMLLALAFRRSAKHHPNVFGARLK
jgi:hypothetical protein